MVTVSSGGQSPPTSLFTVSQCGDPSSGFLTLGCVTSGFSPAESLKFTWGEGVSDVVQYPAVQIQDGKFTAVSQARVKAADWDAQKTFTCQAENSAGKIDQKPFKKPVVPEQVPTLLLTTPTQADLENGTATFICVASDFAPKESTFTWKRDNKEISGRVKQPILSEEKSTFTTYTSISILELTAEEWVDTLSTIKCEFNHKTGTKSKEAKYTVISEEETEKVEISPPSSEDMLVRKAGTLQCKATGRKGFRSIRWMEGEKNITSETLGKVDSSSLTAKATISYDEWNKGTKYVCVVEHKLFAELWKSYPYSRDNGKRKQCPSVYLLPPPENIQEDEITLTCYVKNFYPKDVVVFWLANDEKLNNTEKFQQRTTSVIEIEKDQLYSVYSHLVIRPEDWESGTVYSCLVYHEAIDPTVRLISRSIDNVSNKPTLVSLSMNVPSTCSS